MKRENRIPQKRSKAVAPPQAAIPPSPGTADARRELLRLEVPIAQAIALIELLSEEVFRNYREEADAGDSLRELGLSGITCDVTLRLTAACLSACAATRREGGQS